MQRQTQKSLAYFKLSTADTSDLYEYILRGPAQKVPPQNKNKKFYLKDKYLIFKLIWKLL